MSEITDLTAAVKELTNQLKGGPGGGRGGPEDRRAERIGDLQQRNTFLKDEANLIKEIARNEKERVKLENENKLEQLSNTKELLRIGALEGEAKEKAIKDVKRLSNETEGYTKTVDKATAALKRQKQAFKAGAAEADNLLNGFLGLSGEGARFFQIVGNGTTSLLGFVGGLAKSVFTGDLLVKSFQKLIGNSINFAFELDRQNAQLKAATGAGNEFSDVIGDAGSEYLTFGVNAADAGRATQALFGTFRDFTNLSKSEQTNIAETAAILDKFGVSSAQTGQILDQATKSLYMNSQQAEALTREAATLAISIGKPITEVAGDLASAAPKLAFYGQQMFDVFAQLERQSKATGLSVDSLLGLVGEKFDTFEGAGQAVGRLNAILGGPYLNSIDMLNASEADRLEMIKEAIKAGGVQFDQLNKFEQKAFASALGTDVDTLRRSLNELDPEVQLQALRQEELAKRAGDARDIMTKLTDAINSLIIRNKPLMDSIVKGVDKFSELIFQINKGEKSTIDLGKAIFGILPGWMKWVLGIGLAFKGISMVVGAVKGFLGLKAAIAAAQASATAGFAGMSAAASPLLAVLLPIAAIIAGIGGGAYAISKASQAAAAGQTGKAAAIGMGGGALAGAATGAAIGSIVPVIGTGVGALVGGAIGLATGTAAAGGAFNDATMPASIQMAKFNNQDTFERVGNSVVAAKPDGTLDKAIRESVEKQTAVLVEAIQNAMNVKVQVGDQQLGDVVVKAMNSTRGRNSISPFYEG
tara:strand:+ start:8992 stop:11262 length:2271 start_codon:yes stop_codon:yes gene_type:complete